MAGEALGSCAHCGREDTVRARFPDTAEHLVLPALECSSCGARWAGRRLAEPEHDPARGRWCPCRNCTIRYFRGRGDDKTADHLEGTDQ